MNIAIDGPGGAGKSTVAKILSKKLNILYLDTGAMYRALGLKAYRLNFDPKSAADESKIEKMLDLTSVSVVYENGAEAVLLDGEDVTKEIREHVISSYASDISKIRAVRLKMVELQRRIAASQSSVLDGRDIGSFVLPYAEYKFYLTADVSERAKRRFLELTGKGEKCSFEQVERDIAARDYNDQNREFAPLKKAADAVEIDTTLLSAEEAADKIISMIKI
jgi:cytidylate kinase